MKTWRFITIILTALSMAAAFGHLLELPAKMGFSGAKWLDLNQTLYGPGFGTLGAFCEVGAVISVLVLAVVVRRRRPAFAWTVAAAASVCAAHAVFWFLVAPVNAEIAPLSPDTLPKEWADLRMQWEYSHAARAILQMAALAALIVSILAETPRTLAERPATATGD